GTWSVSPSIGSGWTLRQQTANPDGDAAVLFDAFAVPAGTYNETVTASGVVAGSTESIIATFVGITGSESQQPCFFLLM
ncbi:MAG TPA: hypothetical protein VGE93_01580, partial [Bryobacteraceae bacterium]